MTERKERIRSLIREHVQEKKLKRTERLFRIFERNGQWYFIIEGNEYRASFDPFTGLVSSERL